MSTAEKKYLKPQSVDEALRLAAAHVNTCRYVAGGTDVFVNKFQGTDDSACLIDITGINEMEQVLSEADYLRIGSLVRLDDLRKHEIITRNFPALIEAAHGAATPVLRKTATLGGNILCENRCSFFNQSEWWREAAGYCLKCGGHRCLATGKTKACFSRFVSNTAPVLISLDAQVEVADSKGVRTIPLESMYTGDGINPRNLSKTSLVTFIILPTNQPFITVFRKLRPRQAVDFSSLTTAVSVNESGRMKIVIGGVDPKPVVIEAKTGGKREEYSELALKKCRLVDNDYYSRAYRREMIRVFLERSFGELHEKSRRREKR